LLPGVKIVSDVAKVGENRNGSRIAALNASVRWNGIYKTNLMAENYGAGCNKNCLKGTTIYKDQLYTIYCIGSKVPTLICKFMAYHKNKYL